MEIDERKIRILQAIINDYIKTGEPVGSRTISRRYDIGLSSATIRNEMADLEDMGYLEHIHTSSGRKPSDKGYRLYVDKLMQPGDISLEEELLINGVLINAALFEVDKVLRKATVLLSRLTNLACVVKTPSVKKSCLKTIQLISIDNNNLLSVIVTDSGIIKNNIIRINNSISSDKLLKINNILNIRLKSLTIEDINLEVINNLKKDLIGYDDIFNAIIPVLYECLNEEESSNVFMEGETNIFQYPEYKDMERAREFLSFINDKEFLKKLLPDMEGTVVSIGEENYIPEAKDYSVISKTYFIRDKSSGSIGIIGPTRMDYSKVITILNRVIDTVNKNLNTYDDW